MKISKLVSAVAVGSMLTAQVIASDITPEFSYENQYNYRYENSENQVPEYAEQERKRYTERNRLKLHLSDQDGDGFKFKTQSRHQVQERYQTNHGDFGSSGASRAAGKSKGSGRRN